LRDVVFSQILCHGSGPGLIQSTPEYEHMARVLATEETQMIGGKFKEYLKLFGESLEFLAEKDYQIAWRLGEVSSRVQIV
jgi:hypothetical protein